MSSNTFLATLASYLPPLIVRHYAADPSPPSAPSAERFAAAVLFADISGFTALTERLAQQGPTGAEELTRVLNLYFSQLVDLVVAHGGEVMKFAGDALLALWPAGGVDADLTVATQRAAQCGLMAQRRLHAFQASDDIRLFLKISVGVGDLRVVHVGGGRDRWEFFLAGKPIEQVGQAAHHAHQGEVVLSADAQAALAGCGHGALRAEGCYRLDSLDALPPRAAPAPVLRSDMADALQVYLPGAIRTHIAAGHAAWLGELRRITVLFLNLPDVHYATPLADAQRIMRALQASLYRYEGSVNKLSVDDKGVTMVAALGLAPLAHEDDPVRGVQAALAMQEALRAMGLRWAIGVTTGRVFCGIIGNAARQEYTIIGDAVNLAARLMQVARGDLLCDTATMQAARGRFPFDTLPPITVKGKAEPVAIYRPRAQEQVHASSRSQGGRSAAGTSRDRSTLIGRAAEMDRLVGHLQALARGGETTLGGAPIGGGGAGGSVLAVIIEGEAGIGKSVLVDELCRRGQALGIRPLIAGADAIEQTTPYHPWRRLGRQLPLSQEADDDPSAVRNALLHFLPDEPQIEAQLPLLNGLLPPQLPETELTRHLPEPVRVERTHELWAKLLLGLGRGKKTLLVLEDAQWFDSVSWELLEVVLRQLTDVMVVLTTRPLLQPLPQAYQRLYEAQATERIYLPPLGAADSAALICQCLGASRVPDAVVELINRRAGGNPLFSEELTYALRDSGVLRIEGNSCDLVCTEDELQAVPFPETIDGVITSRLDRLPLPHQLLLKVASVVGRDIPLRLLLAVAPKEVVTQAVQELEDLQKAGLILPTQENSERAYRFKSILTREVIYNLMPIAQRRPLHQQVALWYEHTHARDLARFWPLLAYHYSLAGLATQAVPYWLAAGQDAIRATAMVEAVSHLSKGLALLEDLPPGVETDRQELELRVAMGTAIMALKGWPAAELGVTLRRAHELCLQLSETAHLPSILWGLWVNSFTRGQHRQALDWVMKMMAVVGENTGADLILACYSAAVSYFWLGDFAAARRYGERVLTLYDFDRDRHLVHAINHDPKVAVLIYEAQWWWILGFPDRALVSVSEKDLLARRLTHPFNLAFALSWGAAAYAYRREPERIMEQTDEAITLGIMHRLPVIHAIVAPFWKAAALLERGQFTECLELLRPAVAAWSSFGGQLNVPYCLGMMAQCMVGLEQAAEGLSMIDAALTQAAANEERAHLAELWRIKGELLTRGPGGDSPQAHACFEQALRIAREQQARSWELRTALSLARLLRKNGQLQQARDLLQPIYATFTEGFTTPDLQEAAALLAHS